MSHTTFLIIDDNSIDRMIAKAMLNKFFNNPIIFTAESSDEAILWLKNEKPNLSDSLLILLDMHMPNVDGFAFLEEYEKLSELIKTNNKIAMLSSSQDMERIHTARNHSLVDEILDKPITEETISQIKAL